MSISGIANSLNFHYQLNNQQTQAQKFRQEFQQLGQDLQAGNLSAAQSDFTQLQQASSQNSNPIAQAFTQLGQDLQSGNVTAAQQDFATIQQDIQNAATQGHHHHHHHAGGAQDSNSSQTNAIFQAFTQLGQSLQAGNLSAAQQAYAAIQQDIQQFAGVQGVDTASPASGTVNATA